MRLDIKRQQHTADLRKIENKLLKDPRNVINLNHAGMLKSRLRDAERMVEIHRNECRECKR